MSASAAARPLVLLGMGNVHRSLLRILESRAGDLAERYGAAFPVAACGDRSGFVRGPDAGNGRLGTAAILAGKERGGRLRDLAGAEPVTLEEALAVAGPRGILLDAASMDLETGGAGLRAARAALERGLSVVFANKSAVALAFDEIEALAAARGAGLGWSATACGGLPVVNAGRRDLVAASFRRLRGVFNATSNLVLDGLGAGRTLEAAIAEAQRRGIAETDPTNDLSGADTAAKLVILARTVLGVPVRYAEVERVGVEGAGKPAPGEAIRLLGEAVREGGATRFSVRPVAVPRESFFGGIGSLDMAVEWETDLYGVQRLSCTEGDAVPTAAAMLRDAVHIAQGNPTGPWPEMGMRLAPDGD